MTHTRKLEEFEGEFGSPESSTRRCRICDKPMIAQPWSSSDGAYEDTKYQCPDGHVEWVDGIDA